MSKPIMLSENSRKSATKLLLVNWSRFSNVPIALEGSTLFTGVNGSGKSTILDAMTYMLTGNTQFNKAALDRDRNVVSYVRGDTKSEGKNRFIREGEVTSYIAMEFWAPLENQYLVVGVCIEYVNETSNTKKWFVFKDTRIDDCRFYTVKEKEVTVYPRHELTVKGKKVPAGEFMNRDKGTEQVLRALGLRCGVEKYRAKLVKMMAFNPENNIDKFIQECVLDEHPIRSMSDIREHRNHYNEAKKVYEELANGKIQLEVVQSKIADYEASERKYEVRRILLLYQETKWHQEHRVQLEEKIDVDKAKLHQLQSRLEDLTEKRKNALDRKINAEKNELLCSIEEITKSLESSISAIEKEIEKYEKALEELQLLETRIREIMDWFETDGELTDKDVAVIETIAETTFNVDIDAVNWDETRYIFDIQKRIDEKKTEVQNKKIELTKIENTPGFAAALQEKESADKEYKEVDGQFINVNNCISTCREKIRDNEEKYDESDQQIKKAKHEYDNAILQRLELRKEMVELYDKLRIKSDSARVMTTKNVENVRGEKESAIRILENEQRKYWHIIGQSDEKYGIGFIPLFREQYRDIANVKIEEAKQKLDEQQHVLENAFMVDFVAEINEAIREAKEEIDEINKALKDIPFGKDTYQFKMLEKPDRMVFFNLCKKLESYMNSMDVYRAINQDDEEMEYNIRQFMDTILEEENEEEYTDYRKYFKYDMRILSRQDGEEVLADLSKKQGSASNGEKQTPYFIILAASLLQCYPKNVSCARLAFIDEAFSALSRERIEQMVKFFEDNKFQVIYAAPPEKIDSIGSHINSTISLCMKGKYTWAVEGLVKLDEFKTE